MARIEALLSARLFLVPQRVGNRLYFLSDLSGRLSLYAMDLGGSVPEPLIPPDIALQNPHHMDGYSFYVFPNLGKILVMIDRDGDENYEPMLIPITGGFPVPAFGERFAGMQVGCQEVDRERGLVYMTASSRTESLITCYQGTLASGKLVELGQGMHGPFFSAANANHTRFLTADGYGVGDTVIYLHEAASPERRLVFGTPLEQRKPGQVVKPSGMGAAAFVEQDDLAICVTSLFSDTYGLALLALDGSQRLEPVAITGTVHEGIGELDSFKHVAGNRYRLGYNIDGASWSYEGILDIASRTLHLDTVLCGQGELANGVLEAIDYDSGTDSYAFSFSTATTPTQIYTREGLDRSQLVCHTRERILGVPAEQLAAGEDASFVSHDGLRISARLYLPGAGVAEGPYPLVYYIHGGPQGQERPDFSWFSMPLIQFLTLNGFAVFVPNVRGSSGYGFAYMDHVTHDWGGQDRLDHVHAMTKVLPNDKRLDLSRSAVIGRSYGGYMTLTLAGRHPELWRAAVDMFGPYDLLTFSERIPETWKPYMAKTVGDPVTERDFLIERSPRTYIGDLRCPMLVIQGANDPRVIERESEELVEELRGMGKQVEFLVFKDEGHDILKFANKVRCYNTITDFFKQHLAG